MHWLWLLVSEGLVSFLVVLVPCKLSLPVGEVLGVFLLKMLFEVFFGGVNVGVAGVGGSKVSIRVGVLFCKLVEQVVVFRVGWQQVLGMLGDEVVVEVDELFAFFVV